MAVSESEHQQRADLLVGRFLDHVLAHEPVQATRTGLDGRDGELPDLAPGALGQRSRDLAVLAAEVGAALAEVGPGVHGADREARGDLLLLEQEVAYRRFLLDERPRFVLDPLAVLDTISAGIHELLRVGDGPAGERCRRLEAAAQRARRVPVLLEQAGRLLSSSPAPHLDVAAQRLPGLLALVRDELPRRAEALGVDVSPARDAGEVAGEGLEAYGALLDELSEEPAADWRLGVRDHALTLRAGLGTTMDPRDIEDRARIWMRQVTAELDELAAAGWQRRFPGEARPGDPRECLRRSLEQIADTAVRPDQLVAEARRALHEARAFVESTGLTDLPSADRLVVREVPPHLRGIAVAFLVPPPPLRPDAGCTFYLAPVPDRWGEEQARPYLREYHPAQLRSLAIHEGYPGHFVQLEHAARHPRLARRLLSRPVFAEGWAVYIEREVLAAGFGDDEEVSVAGDDYRLTQRRLELQVAAFALLDVGLHAGTLDDDDAVRLLTGAALQPPAQARATVARAKVAPGQLCAYFVGGEELLDLRLERERIEGHEFDPTRFHQQVLSHGTPTVPMVAAALRDHQPVLRPFAGPG